jgi:diaminopimelate epimerase
MRQPIHRGPAFAKYSGAGNDFVIVEVSELGSLDPSLLAIRLCDRTTGVGVDGLALVRIEEPGRVAIRFFNPDGSEFGTCGNGTRSVALWAADRGHAPDGRLEIRTSEGPIAAVVRGDRVELDYALEARIERRLELPWAGEPRAAWLVQIGTPHLVVPLEAVPDGPIEELARPLRHRPELGPAGANVNFVAPAGEDRVRIRTFERGIEAETLACGAGAMASTIVLEATGACGPSLRLHTRSGDDLEVTLSPEEPGRPRSIRLAGPARRVFEGRLYDAGHPGDAGDE